MKIKGRNQSLDGVIEGIIILDDIIEKNRHTYRSVWPTWLPEEDGKKTEDKLGRMSYIPVVAMKKCQPGHQKFKGKVRDIPYFVLVLNQARETRPKSEDKAKDEEKGHCKLCKNILERGMIISEIDNYLLTPNGYPYHDYASLLIYNGTNKPQTGVINEEDIATWMKTSILLDQYVFFNAVGAGASIKEHRHAQVVDPKELKIENELIPYPIMNESFVSRESVNGREDVFRLTNYPVDALIFTGRNAPHKAAYAADLVYNEGNAYNILVNKNEVFVIGRNREREKSICIRRKVGGYEISGVALLGDIEEKSGGLKIKMDGARIFTNMTYSILAKNLIAAAINLGGIANHF